MFFYLPQPLKLYIDSEESGHFFSMRIAVGDELKTTDLNGCLTEIKITSVDRKSRRMEFVVLKQDQIKEPLERTLFQAITDKLYQEKLIEIAPLAGITKIYFFHSGNSILNKVNIERLEKIMIRSCEQSQQCFKTKISFINNIELHEKLKFFQPKVLDLVRVSQNPSLTNDDTNAVIVGPEGGFTDQERNTFTDLQLSFANLGENIFPSWLAGFVYFTRN